MAYPNLPIRVYNLKETPQQNNIQMLLLADAAGTAFVELVVPGVPLGNGVTTAAYRSVVIVKMEAIKSLANQKIDGISVIGRREVHRTDQALLDRLLERGLVHPLDSMFLQMPHAPSKLEGDEHRRTRREFFGRDFSVPRIKQQAGSIEEIVEAALLHLEEVIVSNGGIVDLVGDYAAHLPARVTAMKLGVPDGMEDQIHCIVSQVFSTQSLESMLEFDKMVRSLYRGDLPEGKLKDYQETVRLGGKEAEKIIQVTKQIFAGAYDTGVSLISSALMHLAMEPGVAQALLQGKISIAQVREETLRRDAPASTLYSAFLTAPVRLDGSVLDPEEELPPAGQYLDIGTPIGHGWGAANLDPKAYDEAQIWDPRRIGEANVGYGAGAHICPGAALANEMAELAISAIAKRYNIKPTWEGWEQGAEPARVPSPIANQCTEVRVKLTRR